MCGARVIDELVEGRLNVERVGKLDKAPAPVRAKVIDAGNPQLLHRLRLELRVAATIALGFEDEVQRLLATVVDADDEVRDVAARRRAVAVRDLEIEALV